MSVTAQLAKSLNKNETDVIVFLFNAPKKYKVYTIPKRKHGHRVIAQPSKELKVYQKAFIDENLHLFPVHRNATAYRKGMGIKENAAFHSSQSYLLKMDLENFFNSINPSLFWSTWLRVNGQTPTKRDQQSMESLLFWCPSKKANGKLVLSVGAPSSPTVSNFCMYHFDELITKVCVENGIYYTRYADDLTFSTNEKGLLFSIPEVIQKTLKECFGQRLTINHSKTKFSSKAHNRHVTGITISNDGSLSLGRERKRYIKHLVHMYICNNLNYDDIDHLKGLLSFAKHIEPRFITSLISKYSRDVVQRIMEK